MSVVTAFIVAIVSAEAPAVTATIETVGENVTDIEYSQDGSAIFCIRDHFTVQSLDADSGIPIWTRESDHPFTALAAHLSKGLIATTGFGDVISIRNADTGESVHVVDTPRYYFHGVDKLQFVDGGNSVIAAGAAGRVLHANLETGRTRKLGVSFGERDWPRIVDAYTVSDDSKLVAAATRCSVTRFVSFGESEPVKPIGDAHVSVYVPITAVAFAPDGTMLAMGMDHFWGHFELIFWSIDGARVREAARVRIPYRVDDIFYTERPDEIVVVSSNRVSVWNLVEQAETGTVLLDAPAVRCAAYCPARREIAVGMRDGTISRISLGSSD